MEPLKKDSLKLPNMIMCGDHPSLTKTELNLKVKAPEVIEQEKKLPLSYARISPTSSRTETQSARPQPGARSEHALRARRLASPEATPDNREILHAAIGSFRWPPYLVLAWLLILAAAHALHALAAAVAGALPVVRKLCAYCRTQTAESWSSERELRQRWRTALLASATAALYALRGALGAAHALLRWALEPLGAELRAEPHARPSGVVTALTDYADFLNIEDVKKLNI